MKNQIRNQYKKNKIKWNGNNLSRHNRDEDSYDSEDDADNDQSDAERQMQSLTQ